MMIVLQFMLWIQLSNNLITSRQTKKRRDVEDAQGALEGLVSVLSLELDVRKLARDILHGLVATRSAWRF